MMFLKVKRLIDIILSGLGLIILAPVFLIFILAIKVDSQNYIIYKICKEKGPTIADLSLYTGLSAELSM